MLAGLLLFGVDVQHPILHLVDALAQRADPVQHLPQVAAKTVHQLAQRVEPVSLRAAELLQLPTESSDSGAISALLVIGELRTGVERRRRRDPDSAGVLERWLNGMEHDFADRILAVDLAIADLWG